jgi:hypothetical protein
MQIGKERQMLNTRCPDCVAEGWPEAIDPNISIWYESVLNGQAGQTVEEGQNTQGQEQNQQNQQSQQGSS